MPRAFVSSIRLTRRQVVASLTGLVAAVAAPGSRSILRQPDGVAAQGVTESTARYFAETGHNLKDPFLSRWQAAGGQAVLGAPISEERYDPDVGVVQNFEALALVFNPALDPPWDVQGQHLPAGVGDQIAPAAARKPVAGCPAAALFCQFFPQTGHSLSGGLASFWSVSGDLAILGMPTSEPFPDPASGATVQVFERAVLEDHGAQDVRLRPLGKQQAAATGLQGDPAFRPAPPNGGVTQLVRSPDGLRLRTGPRLDADVVVVLPDNAEFIAAPGGRGAWVAGYTDGYSGWVSADFLKTAPPLPTIARSQWNTNIWQGAALGQTNVRAEPTTRSPVVTTLAYGAPVIVTAWVKGEEVFTGADEWAQIGPGRYVYARNVGRNAPVLPTPLPPDAPTAGKWIDVDLTQQLMTAYDGRTAVRTVVMTSGMAGWETPSGVYAINNRVPNETMTSGAIGAEHYYKLDNVLFTQYFTDRGHAIHYAWWRTPETIGRPGSHGCLNVLLDDARFFWDWATIGTPVSVHE